MSQKQQTVSVIPDENGLIPIVGYGPKPYAKVKEAVIYLGGSFYFKDDTENLVKVKDPTGKKRLFRKTSKLVVRLDNGKFVHRSSAVRTEDGVWLDKDDPDTVVVDGKYTRREYVVEVEGKLYLKTDPNLRVCAVSKVYTTVENSVPLSSKYYGQNSRIDKRFIKESLTLPTGDVILKGHGRLLMDAKGEEVWYHVHDIADRSMMSVFRKFRDSTNPQLDRIDLINTISANKKHFIVIEEIGHYVHVNMAEEVKRIYNEVILVREAKETEELKKLLKYGDDGPDENQAKVVKKITQPWPGKHQIFVPRGSLNVTDRANNLVGGLNYTFGIEYETSQGLLGNSLAEKTLLKVVGDRSIGAAEYVTGVLQGNAGVELMKQQCDALAAYTLVDNRCGLHCHVAGPEPSRHLAINAIKLGVQIEEELYRSFPDTRSPTMKHCHSIKRWEGINEENWREYLGAYVFGELENWNEPFSFHRYKYGSEGRSRNDRVDTWCPARYKWLNLIHILSRSTYGTVELRIFPGSTNFDKIYNYLLTSMAFVWFADNRPNLIAKGGVTLNMMFSETFDKYPELVERLNKFYKERTERFKRGDIYPPTGIPKAIF